MSFIQAWDKRGGVTGQKNNQVEHRQEIDEIYRQTIMKSFIGRNTKSPIGFESLSFFC